MLTLWMPDRGGSCKPSWIMEHGQSTVPRPQAAGNPGPPGSWPALKDVDFLVAS